MGGKRQFRGGGRGGHNKRARHGNNQGGGKQNRGGWEGRQTYPVAEKTNAQMEAYYQMQKIVPEDEWEKFLAAARAPLPTTFRISPTCTFADEIRDKLKARHEEFVNDPSNSGDDALRPPQPLVWYPDELAWFMTVSKNGLKRTPGLEKFHQYLVAETESGNITRQEAVSMIPPLFMDVEPHHRVLDMCAAPGSKMSQLLEFVHAKCGSNGVPPGIVLANDADQDRCKMLIHQMKRLSSPSLLVLNHDAEKLPMLWMAAPEDTAAEHKKQRPIPFRFDRVLADVPCSGDGTMRKNVDVWRKWTPGQGAGLHTLQTRILTRGVELAQEGGVVVYSTCSMNPIENEAVVAHVLSQFPNSLELVDVSQELPNLVRSQGLETWRVRDRMDGSTWWDTFEQVPDKLKQVLSAFEQVPLTLIRCLTSSGGMPTMHAHAHTPHRARSCTHTHPEPLNPTPALTRTHTPRTRAQLPLNPEPACSS